MRLTEPMTLSTDYLLGALALWCAVRLLQQAEHAGAWTVRLWAVAMLMTAAAAFVGGSYHGFVRMLAPETGRMLWQITLIATGLGSAALLASAALAGTEGALQKALLAIVLLKLGLYLWWIASRTEFIFVIADYGSALVGVVLLVWLARPSGLTPGASWIAGGVAVSVVAAAIQALRLAPHRDFNHNDLFHVVQMAAVYLLYRGGLLLR